MIPDNQWHPAILYKIGDAFQIAESFSEAEKDPRISGPVFYQEIKYNWNKGQPIVELANGERLTITDIDTNKPDTNQMSEHVKITKQLRVDLDAVLQRLKEASGIPALTDGMIQRPSRERAIAITKLQEAIMWLGMDLKGLKEAGLSDEPTPYPSSYDPKSPVVEPTAQGLKL